MVKDLAGALGTLVAIFVPVNPTLVLASQASPEVDADLTSGGFMSRLGDPSRDSVQLPFEARDFELRLSDEAQKVSNLWHRELGLGGLFKSRLGPIFEPRHILISCSPDSRNLRPVVAFVLTF